MKTTTKSYYTNSSSWVSVPIEKMKEEDYAVFTTTLAVTLALTLALTKLKYQGVDVSRQIKQKKKSQRNLQIELISIEKMP